MHKFKQEKLKELDISVLRFRINKTLERLISGDVYRQVGKGELDNVIILIRK
jgi:hypothetical protein